jgi:hypothetical protein
MQIMTLTISSQIFKKPITWVIIILFLVISGGGLYLLIQNSPELNSSLDSLLTSKSDPLNPMGSDQVSPTDTAALIAEVSKIIELPTGEEPTVAVITDVTQLQDQEFFQKAQNGDRVLIYSQAKKAFLYNPTLKKIIDVQPIAINTPTPQPATGSAVPSESVSTPTLSATPSQ